MTTSLFLQRGTVLTHDGDDHVVPLYNTDVLIHGNIITAIDKDLESTVDGDVDIIDCQGKIISPGYIDTHHHVWQTQLKGRHAEEGLVAYMVTGNMMSYAYTPSDIYWGQLSGCLEALNAGTTTVLDHSHAGYTAEHVSSAVDATVDSGIRSVFAYAIPVRMAEWNESSCVINNDLMAGWAYSQIEQLASRYNNSESSHRVEIGYGFDWWFLPKEVSLSIFKKLRKSGIRLVTSHVGMQVDVSLLESYGVLRAPYPPPDKTPELPFFVFSHCNGYSYDELSVLARSGAPISSTPETEAQMGIGYPVALHPSLNSGARTANVGLGIDCHSIVPSSIILQARALLHLTRVEHNSQITAAGRFPAWNVRNTSEDVFNIATIKGARSLGLDSEIGSIQIGKKADIVVFDALNSVGMLSAAEYDPVVAIVRFSEAADIDTVIVDGIIRKRGGRLVDVKSTATKATVMPWQDIAKRVRQSQEDIQARISGLNIKKGKETLFSTFRTDLSTLADATV
ncbi:amidohydrolase family [Fusarium denticulatum]|uniref:Amidohydrolase family n=1 Tax=Fusarium denticulatum TaxID=48507 RepID=A0A8H5TM43_9HYPO|nr:amidohydrolase family [Fusarium denticulatum]